MKKKIYIAGKVSGEPLAECTMKFGRAQKLIESLGFEVINPLQIVDDWKTPWQKAMKMCITAMMDCDAIFLLTDYTDSLGAMIEKKLAYDVKMLVFYDLETLKLYKWNNSPLTL